MSGFVDKEQLCEISSSHGGEYDVHNCLLGSSGMMMESVRISETSVDNHFTRQYIPEDNSEQRTVTFTTNQRRIKHKDALDRTDSTVESLIYTHIVSIS
jgi:hypothetical protein